MKGVSFGGCKVQFFTQDVLLNTASALFSVICCNDFEFEPFDLTTLRLCVSQILLIKSKWAISYSLSGAGVGECSVQGSGEALVRAGWQEMPCLGSVQV